MLFAGQGLPGLLDPRSEVPIDLVPAAGNPSIAPLWLGFTLLRGMPARLSGSAAYTISITCGSKSAKSGVADTTDGCHCFQYMIFCTSFIEVRVFAVFGISQSHRLRNGRRKTLPNDKTLSRPCVSPGPNTGDSLNLFDRRWGRR